MAQLGISLLVLLLSIFYFAGTIEPTMAQHSRSQAFVEASCRNTRYPELCVHCLSSYPNTTQLQSPQQLAQVALTVSLARAQNTRAYVLSVARKIRGLRTSDYQIVKDCLEQINDGVNQLGQSIRELQRMSETQDGGDFMWHTSNVESWVSAALTDANTCLDGFSGHGMGGKMRATIKAKVLNVAQVTSNALALFHHFVARHQATGTAKKP